MPFSAAAIRVKFCQNDPSTSSGRPRGRRTGSIVLREDAADDVFVDIDAKGTRNLLCDAGSPQNH
jgi:hypothetical protein